MSVRARIVTFFGLLFLSCFLLAGGVAVMVERVFLGPNGGPVAMGLFLAAILLVPLSFWILTSGPKRPQ